jgi:hypothetical protein
MDGGGNYVKFRLAFRASRRHRAKAREGAGLARRKEPGETPSVR